MRTESIGDVSSSSDEFYDSGIVAEVQKYAINDQAVSQVLAETIVNAFSEVNKNRMLSSSFIPSFIATSKDIRIIMYNCELDSLIMLDDLKIFIYDEVKGKNTLNVSTILSIWYALNFENYFNRSTSLFPEFEYMLSQISKNKLVKSLRYIMKSVLNL
ncbi:uncharacterized protein LOC132759346 [Ruditapes philippinarum]|uniref:uncharacterized protein LOC132759346 n=1 Tax=Ruditapes philippinarum TaxID=129788 RepID=UPI00295BEEFB|nr:uncharacterized protein LOC132759346 [Ruditapes philippinarum]